MQTAVESQKELSQKKQSSVVFLSEMAALAWMEGYRSVCCQKLLYHYRAFMHRQGLKWSDCAGVSSAPYRLHYPHLTISAKSLRPAFPTGAWREQGATLYKG